MNKYKLLAVDMDGTLLTTDKTISPETLEKINEMGRAGKIFCISTGRPFAGIKKYSDLIENNIPLITYNGAIVRFSKSDEVLLSETLSAAQSKKILDIIVSHSGTYVLWAEEKIYASVINDVTKAYFSISGVQPVLIEKDTVIPHGSITKIIWFDENSKLKEYQRTFLKGIDDVNFFTSQPTFLEFVSKNISKANAMKTLADYYGLTKENMVAVGDGCNDIPMIRYAGLGVAMANSEDEVLSEADEVTSSNDEDGVAKVIEKYFLD